MKMKPVYSFIGKVGALLAICAMPGSNAFAKHLQPEEALSILASGQFRSVSTSPLKLAYTEKSTDAVPTVYVFNHDGAAGFYVLAADDAVGNIVLGYSNTGRFSADNMAPGMKWLLKTYSAKVSSWASAAAPAAPNGAPAGLAEVAPLLTTVWDQYEPFNDLCPEVDGEKCLTGCVATAMAQIMKKHQWPVTGTGSFSYDLNGMTVSSDFSSHTYDWGNMIDDYYGWVQKEDGYYQEIVGTPEQNAAVAQLMFDCGVASRMAYTPQGSGAQTIVAASGMLEYFNYDKSMLYLLRDWYTDDEWFSLMHEQISQGLPVMYGGVSVEDYGHQFILDGYDGKGYFHFNWGWGGYGDGYFTLDSNAAPGEGIEYCVGEDALINIRPDMGSAYAPLMCVDGVLCTDATEYASESGWIQFSVENHEGGFWSMALGTIEYEFGVMTTLDGSVVSLGGGNLQPNYGFIEISAPCGGFPIGEYDVYMVFKTPSTDWAPMRYNVNITNGRLHFVNNGTTIIVSESTGGEEVTTITLNTTAKELNVGESFTLIAAVTPGNATDETVTWTSSDASIASVDADGKVTAIAAGIATVTATYASVSATCVVTVLDPVIDPTDIILNTQSIDLLEGESFRLVATVIPENTTYANVDWTTSDASVATVDADGNVTGVAAGSATITATCGSVSTTCAVTVTKPVIEASAITLNTQSVDLAVGETAQLIATVSPADTSDPTVTWTTSDAAVATVDADGMVTAISVGTATITATCGAVSATCVVEVKPLDGIWGMTTDGVAIRVLAGTIHIQAPADAKIAIYDAAGSLYYAGSDREIPVAAGKCYIVVVGDKSFKVKA